LEVLVDEEVFVRVGENIAANMDDLREEDDCDEELPRSAHVSDRRK
jgi:hypothetical protein